MNHEKTRRGPRQLGEWRGPRCDLCLVTCRVVTSARLAAALDHDLHISPPRVARGVGVLLVEVTRSVELALERLDDFFNSHVVVGVPVLHLVNTALCTCRLQ